MKKVQYNILLTLSFLSGISLAAESEVMAVSCINKKVIPDRIPDRIPLHFIKDLLQIFK